MARAAERRAGIDRRGPGTVVAFSAGDGCIAALAFGESMNIYVGSLAREVTEDDLKEAFGAFGTVASAAVIKDKFSGESRGFGFVEMNDEEEAKKAIEGLEGTDLKGSTLRVSQARPKEEGSRGGRPGGGGGRRFGGGGGGGRPGGNRGGYGGGYGGGRDRH